MSKEGTYSVRNERESALLHVRGQPTNFSLGYIQPQGFCWAYGVH